ncbi:hypothetical protein P171DRAFT_429613 [Karstenula rhodostoma CBS 690.94]|uniref:Uncharacterized protein n=1 Tax=Karstenula rhodostoma CBS 690.94 TaxID=1392251 RepID=A0A9P4PMU8_9PLEO|nr:hypothetical protein P171DRAFT_429613 [Karstenula rhodostoma CBS 690.94]
MAPPRPRRRTRPNNTPLHRRGALSDGRLENLDPIVDQPGTSNPVFSALSAPRTDATPPTHSLLEQLPVEVVNNILLYLVHPRSRLPGLTEQQSTLDANIQRAIKANEDLHSPPDTDRFAADLFAWTSVRHPFNALAASSKRCCGLVESYCAHLVKTCNKFNLPFAHAEEFGADSVYPSLKSIVYRRLWLQTAPRCCLFCGDFMSSYPHRGFRLMLSCADCFYGQTLSLHEVQHQYHIIDPAILTKYGVRGTGPRYEWILRIDVEALALRLYGTRAFHDTLSLGLDVDCSIPNCGLAANLLSLSHAPPVRRFPEHVPHESPRRNRRRGS